MNTLFDAGTRATGERMSADAMPASALSRTKLTIYVALNMFFRAARQNLSSPLQDRKLWRKIKHASRHN